MDSDSNFLSLTSRFPKSYGTITKNTIRSSNSSCEDLSIKKIHRQYREKINQLEKKVQELQEDIAYYDAEHKRELQNLQIMMACQYNKKILTVKKQLREQYEGMEAENKRMKKEIEEKQSQNQILKGKVSRCEKYSKQMEKDARQIEKCLKQEHVKEVKTLKSFYQEEIERLKAAHAFERDMEAQNKSQQISQLNKELETTKNKLSQILHECQQMTLAKKSLSIELEETKLQNANQILKLNAQIEGLKKGSQQQLDQYFREAKKVRREKLAAIEDMCKKISVNKEDKENYMKLEKYQSQVLALQKQNRLLKEGEKRNVYNELFVETLETEAPSQRVESPRFGSPDFNT